MAKVFQKVTTVLLAGAMIISLLFVMAVKSDAVEVADTGLSMDVMFVIDSSASMNKSDPKLISTEACKLFTDMCDYSSARAGYVLFSDKILQTYPLTNLSDENNRQALRTSLSSIKWPSSAATDISLGLTAAMNELIASGSLESGDRDPLIILLSDGRTSDISTQRQAEYAKEYEETLSFLSNKKIPVYTIALTCGDVDEDTMKDIATRTGGLYFATDTADNLADILSQILANELKSSLDPIDEFDGDGTAQTITIPIPNDSIYQANIIILSANGVSDIHLTEPGGNEVVVPSSNVLYNKSGAYQLIKLLQPNKGDWKLTMTGVDKDHVTVNLINSYDVILNVSASKYTVTNGDSVNFSAYFTDFSGNKADSTLLTGAEGILNITNPETEKTRTVDMSWGSDSMTGTTIFDEAGTFNVSAKVIGKDGSYTRESAAITITVNPYPLTKLTDAEEETVRLHSPVLGMKSGTTKDISLSNIFSWDSGATLTVAAVPGGYEGICDFSYDEDTGVLTVNALKSGSATMNLRITDSFGQSGDYILRVKVTSGWLPIIIGLVALAAAVAVFLIVRRKIMPVTQGRLSIRLTLPTQLAEQTPPETDFILSSMNKKGAINLESIIQSNMAVSGMYAQALAGISNVVKSVSVEAGNKDCSTLRISVPASGKAGSVMVNGAELSKARKFTLTPDTPLELVCANALGDQYKIMFMFGNENSGGGFGGNGGGFGNFGGFGGNDGNPSGDGGFGAGNFGGSDSGFGNFGGNDGGSSGGFGSFDNFGGQNDNNSNGGFGGFGSF